MDSVIETMLEKYSPKNNEERQHAGSDDDLFPQE